MSIFTKDCPVCAASHPVHLVRCGCGYCFDPNKIDGVTQELEVISQEEQLYRDYLAARADQADKEWHSARIAAAREPENTIKAADALLAKQTVMTSRAELEAQDGRAKAVKNRIKVVRSNRRGKKVKAAANAPRSTPVSVREAIAPKAAPVAPAPPIHIAPRQAAPAPKPAPPVARPIAPKPKAPAMSLTNNAYRPAVVAPVPVPASRPVVKARPAPAKPAPVVAARPTPVILETATPSFRASQANRAEQIPLTPAKSNSLECPNCYAKVAANTKRCRCGFEMPHAASQIPSLAMSPEDRAAFLAALDPLSSGHSK